MFIPAEIIKKKRNGQPLTKEEIAFFVNSYTAGIIPDYQMASLLMAIFFRGMTAIETVALTDVMKNSGSQLKFEKSKGPAIDKHSTGGIGDKTSLILAPLAACAGLRVPMISGRGLGHTGGTVDKLESIPGFNPFVSEEDSYRIIDQLGVCMMAQTEKICPADKKIYALRDVTGTVESLPLICASIMSKKIAEGIHGLVLDVKYGSGAFMKSIEKSVELANGLMDIGVGAGLNVAGYITNMDQPLGRFVGNSVEVAECLAIMKNEGITRWSSKDLNDTIELTLELAGAMIFLGKKSKTPEEGYQLAKKILLSGEVFNRFEKMCKLQGGDLKAFHQAKNTYEIKANTRGYVLSYNAEQVGIAAILMGAGRQKNTDKLDLTAGIEIFKKIGDPINPGDTLFLLHGDNLKKVSDVEAILLQSISISEVPVKAPQLIYARYFR